MAAVRTPKGCLSGEHYVDVELWHTATYRLDIGASQTRVHSHPLLAASVLAFLAPRVRPRSRTEAAHQDRGDVPRSRRELGRVTTQAKARRR
jgi:hypothetical protein